MLVKMSTFMAPSTRTSFKIMLKVYAATFILSKSEILKQTHFLKYFEACSVDD